MSGKLQARNTATICRHNPANYLGKALKSGSVQTQPGSELEILAVDNALSDGTAILVNEMNPSLPASTHLRRGRWTLPGSKCRYPRGARPPHRFPADDAVATSHRLEAIFTAFDCPSRRRPAPADRSRRSGKAADRLDGARLDASVPRWCPIRGRADAAAERIGELPSTRRPRAVRELVSNTPSDRYDLGSSRLLRGTASCDRGAGRAAVRQLPSAGLGDPSLDPTRRLVIG